MLTRLNKRRIVLIMVAFLAFLSISFIAMHRQSINGLNLSQANIEQINENEIVTQSVKQNVLSSQPDASKVFSETDLKTKLYSDAYLLNNSGLRKQIIHYCGGNLLNTQFAQSNCNAALRDDTFWFQISIFISELIKYGFSSTANFLFVSAVFFLFLLLGKLILNLTDIFTRSSPKALKFDAYYKQAATGSSKGLV